MNGRHAEPPIEFSEAHLPSVRLDTLTDFQVTRVDAMDLDS